MIRKMILTTILFLACVAACPHRAPACTQASGLTCQQLLQHRVWLAGEVAYWSNRVAVLQSQYSNLLRLIQSGQAGTGGGDYLNALGLQLGVATQMLRQSREALLWVDWQIVTYCT